MENKDFRKYELTVKIRNDFIVVTSDDFGINRSGGSLYSFALEEIGAAVIKCFHGITDELAKGNFGEKKGSDPGGSRLLTIGEAAQILGVSRSTLRRIIARGKIPTAWTEGGHRRINSRFLETINARGF